MPKQRVTPEGALLRQIMDYLAARGILAFRQNTGAVKMDNRFMRFGVPGMADILAFTMLGIECAEYPLQPLWIEVKADTGKQSELQKSFQKQVQWHGHKYVVARSIEDVEAAL